MAFAIKRHDLRPNVAAQFFKADGVTPLPLDDASGVYFVMRIKNAPLDTPPVIKRICAFVDRTLGKVEFEWESGDTDTAGKYEYEFEIDWNGRPQTIPPNGFFALQIFDDAG